MKRIIYLLTVIMALTLGADAQITIEGLCNYKFDSNKINQIKIFRPLNGVPQPWYSDSKDDIILNKDGIFQKTIPAKDTGFFILEVVDGRQFRIFSYPQDTINVMIDVSGKKINVSFKGKKGFYNNYITHISDAIFAKMSSTKDSSLTPAKFWNKVDSFTDSCKRQINENTDKQFVKDYLINYTKIELLNFIENQYYIDLDKKDSTTAKEITDTAYAHYNPLSVKYLAVSPLALINLTDYKEFASTTKETKVLKLFSTADSNWAKLSDSYITPSTLPEPFREAQLGNYILLDKIRLSSSYAEAAMNLFAQQYPDSKYNKIFLQLLTAPNSMRVINDNIIKEEHEADTTIIIADNKELLKDVLKKYAFHKNVLIDCWATWCVYCISEFPYYPQYSDFFKSQNIVKLFISFDDPSFTTAWHTMIDNKKLSGVHLLINPSLKKDLFAMINFPIGNAALPLPRYILLNKDGKVVDADAIRPSKSNFQAYIKNKLIAN